MAEAVQLNQVNKQAVHILSKDLIWDLHGQTLQSALTQRLLVSAFVVHNPPWLGGWLRIAWKRCFDVIHDFRLVV